MMSLKMNLVTLLFGCLIVAWPWSAQACAWSEEWDSDFYRFYTPEFSDLNEFKPFNFTFDRLYDYDLMSDSTSEAANLEEWQRYLGPGIKVADIRSAVYAMTVEELQAIRNGAAKTSASNTLVAEWKAGRRLEVLDYLILAHRAEPFCLYDDPWGEEERNMEGVDQVIRSAVSAAKSGSDPYLRLRYAYQAVRLQQYNGDYEPAIETYRQLVLPNSAASPLIAQWAMCHYAGCLRNVEAEAEAAYVFSRVFDLCPSRRIQSWYGWRILSDDIWEAVQSKCKDNHEMAAVFFLRGYASDADPLDDMRQMQELDPGSKMIEVLMLREVNKIERDLLGYPFSAEKPLNQRFSEKDALDLHAFVNQVMASGKMHDPSAWQLASIYLRFLKGDIAGAGTELAAKQGGLSPEGQLKAKLMALVFRIAALKSVDRSVENTILEDYTSLSAELPSEKADQLKRFRDEALGWLYEAQGEKAKALLARGRGYEIYDTPIDLELVDDMIALDVKEDKTLYETELLDGWSGAQSRKDLLLEIKGTGLLARNLLPEAVHVFRQISKTYRKTSESFSLNADPFRMVITDIVNCEDCGSGKYTKLSFAEKVLELQSKAVSDPSKAAEYNLLLGNAHYNTTYFGAAWNAKDFYRSGGSWGYLGEKSDWFQFDADTFEENVDMRLARDYFDKALGASKKREMAALASFMIAKCELKQSYIDGAESLERYHSGFKRLHSDYSKTRAYQDLIKECGYLSAYAKAH